MLKSIIGLSRRRFFLAPGGVLLGASKRKVGEITRTWPSGAFADSVGVCVNLAADPYMSQYNRFRTLIIGSGIRHLREDLYLTIDSDRWHDLLNHGSLRRHLLATPLTGSAAEVLNYVTTLGVQHFSAVEGQNEGDGWFASQPICKGDWARTVVTYQHELFHTLRSRYTVSQLPVVSPTLLDWKPEDVAHIKEAAGFCDVVGIHPYVQNAQEPETHDSYAALSWYLRHYGDNFKPGAPIMATEVGYTNMFANGAHGISETASSIYLPRLLLHNFSMGVVRTFLYAFMDTGIDPNNSEDHYGLVRFDGMPKPAYHTVRMLLKALADSNNGNIVESQVNISIRGAPPDLRTVAFSAHDGSMTLALWRPLRVWDTGASADIATAEQLVSVAPEAKLAWAAYLSLDGRDTWSETPVSSGEITVPIGARVTLLRMGLPHD